MRRCPTDSPGGELFLRRAILPASIRSSSRRAWADASADVSRLSTWKRIPNEDLATGVAGASARTRSSRAADLWWRLAPGEVGVDVGRAATFSAAGAGPPEEDLAGGCQGSCAVDPGLLDPEVVTVEVERVSLGAADPPRSTVRNSVGAVVPLVVVEVVAETPLLGRVATGHDVQQKASPWDARWKLAAWWAASVGEMRPGRNATRNLSLVVTWVNAAVMIQASSHHVPAGVSTDSNPSCSADRAIWPR